MNRFLWIAVFSGHAFAHNHAVHQDIVDYAYQVARTVQSQSMVLLPGSATFSGFPAPAGVNAAEWSAFLGKVSGMTTTFQSRPSDLPAARSAWCFPYQNFVGAEWAQTKLSSLPHAPSTSFFTANDCGIRRGWKAGGIFDDTGGPANDYTGLALGLWASHVDDDYDDTHFWLRPTNAAGLDHFKDAVDGAVQKGASVLLIPLVCAYECWFGDCSKCFGKAKNMADKLTPAEDVLGAIPIGIGDKSDDETNGVWHHISVIPGVSNEFDDRQGLLFGEAGPPGHFDPLETLTLQLFDVAGLSLNYDKSKGIQRYQITGAGDGHPDTKVRGKSQWEGRSVVHVACEPVDNLGFYEWKKFRDEPEHSVKYLGRPLHALGDATVPMHVAATSFMGHRPFEDAQEMIWGKLRLVDATPGDQQQMARRVLEKAFEWRKTILTWRGAAPGRAKDLPLRELVTSLAMKTLQYANAQQASKGWPFSSTGSGMYASKALKDPSIAMYADRADAAVLGRPLVEEGIAATLAFLMSAAEVIE